MDPTFSAYRRRLAALTLLLVPLGIATKFYAGPASAWVAAYAGGFLYVVFWTLLVLALRPTLSARWVAGCVLVATCALEFLQLWHPPLLEAARRPFLGQALLGTSFTWADFPYYAAGALAAVWISRWLRGRAGASSARSAPRSALAGLLLWCTLFAVAFGTIEGAVVVYLRELYYPQGFSFPLKQIEPRVLSVEIVREAATLLVLLAFARLATAGRLRRFAVFAFCFGVWDLVYYVTLKLWLDWPASILDWDVLFLIPVPWLAPVLAPVLVSLALVAAAVVILGASKLSLRPVDWAVEIGAGVLILASFFTNTGVLAAGGVPANYSWMLFLLGWLGGVAWFAVRVVRSRVVQGDPEQRRTG